MVHSQTSPQLAGELGKPEFEWKSPRIWWKLVVVGVLILLCSGGILFGALLVSDDILAFLGLHTRANFIASAAKFATVFGVGFWAAALVILLHQRELAQASLRKSDAEVRDYDVKIKRAEAEIRESELRLEVQALTGIREAEAKLRQLELAMKTQAIVSVTIDSSVRLWNGGYILTAHIQISNTGTQDTRIKWEGEPPAFYVRSVEFDPDGKEKYGEPQKLHVQLTLDPDLKAPSHLIRAAGTESLHFALRVSRAGLYLLSFRGAVDNEERERVKKESGVKLPTAWTTSQYVFIGDVCSEPTAILPPVPAVVPSAT